MFKFVALACLLGAAAAGDPSSSWMSYAKFDAGAGHTITQLNVTAVVPANAKKLGSSPSFWFGLQTQKGTGALIQPILAWSQTVQGGYGIFHEVFDWNNQRDSRSPESYQVYPGDVLKQSVRYVKETNSYDMYIASKRSGKSISWNYKLEKAQKVPESTAFIVVEHAPETCDMFPASNNVTFSEIYVEVDGKAVAAPKWVPHEEAGSDKCGSRAIVGPAGKLKKDEVMLHWDAQPDK